MDCKKFIQLVEEKKKKALEKKEAPLKWEQKLEAAAKAKATDGAKDRQLKCAKHRRRSVSESDTSSESHSGDGGKRRRSTCKKHQKNAHLDSDVCGKRKEKSKRKLKKRSSGSSDDSSNEYDTGYEEERRRKRRSHRKLKHHESISDLETNEDDEVSQRGYAKYHKYCQGSESSASGSSSDEDYSRLRKRSYSRQDKRLWSESSASEFSSDEDDGVPKRKRHAKHHKHHKPSSLDSDDERGYRKRQLLGKSSDDNHESRYEKSGRHRHHHHHQSWDKVQPDEQKNLHHQSEVKNHLCGNKVEQNGKAS